jgi:hypothetical protein
MPLLLLLLGAGVVVYAVSQSSKPAVAPAAGKVPAAKLTTGTPQPQPQPQPGDPAANAATAAANQAIALGQKLGKQLITDAAGNVIDPATGQVLVDALGNPTSALTDLSNAAGVDPSTLGTTPDDAVALGERAGEVLNETAGAGVGFCGIEGAGVGGYFTHAPSRRARRAVVWNPATRRYELR